MEWRKRILTVSVGLCIVFSLVIRGAYASALTDDGFWGTAFHRHGSIMLLVEVESGRIIEANEAAATFYGYPAEELRNMNIEQINMYSPADVAQERLAAASVERNYFIFDHRLASGEVRTVEVNSYPIDDEETLLFSVIHDITARKAAERELLETHARLRRAEVITGLGSWEFRLSDDQMLLSPGAEQILGLASGDSISALQEVIAPEYRHMRDKALQNLIEENIPYDIELKLHRQEDETILDIHSMAEYDPETNSVFGTLLDITDRKAADLALEASQKKNQYLLSTFLCLQLLAIVALVINILQRRKAQQDTYQNLERNESLVRILQHPTDSLQELLDHALTESIRLTGSENGCMCLYSQENTEFSLSTWSSLGRDKEPFCRQYKTGICKKAAKQGEPIILNGNQEAACLQHGCSLEQGCPANFMALPIFDQGEIVAVLGLTNKATHYNDMDVWQLTLLMNAVWANLERKKGAMALKREKERLKTTLLSVGDGVIATDEHGRVEIINSVAQTLTGWSRKDALGQPFERVFRLIDEYTREPCEDPIKKVLSSGKPMGLANHSILISKRGDEKPIADSAAPIRNSDGEVTGVVLVFRDVEEEKQRVEEIEYLSYHDQLTGLYNRRFSEEQLREWDNARNLPLSIVMADLNNLKLVNDTFGHAVGDQFLKKAAQIFKAVCRSNDMVARWGGDEFILLLPQTTAEETGLVVNRIERALQQETIQAISISMALGWCTKQKVDQDIHAVFRDAENHMYRAKLFQSSGVRGDTIQALMMALYEKNKREEQHSKRVSALCRHVGKELGLSDSEVDELGIVGLFHDIGKIAIEEQILNKTGVLTADEWEEIMRHSEVGYRLLGAVPDMKDVASYVLAHHERWDGNGYPKGIKGENIPLQSRIVAICDAYDAMVGERPYRKSLSKQEALQELRRNAGTQFDPSIAQACVEAITRWDGSKVSG